MFFFYFFIFTDILEICDWQTVDGLTTIAASHGSNLCLRSLFFLPSLGQCATQLPGTGGRNRVVTPIQFLKTALLSWLEELNPDGKQRRQKANLPQLRALLRPADESVFIRLSVCEAIDLRVRAQRAFVVNVAATDSPNTPCVHWLTAVLYVGHASEEANWLARKANVSELVVRRPKLWSVPPLMLLY